MAHACCFTSTFSNDFPDPLLASGRPLYMSTSVEGYRTNVVNVTAYAVVAFSTHGDVTASEDLRLQSDTP